MVAHGVLLAPAPNCTETISLSILFCVQKSNETWFQIDFPKIVVRKIMPSEYLC